MSLVQFVFLVVPALAAAQQPAGTPPVKPPVNPQDKCSIGGQVVNAVTGEPVKKVHITVDRTDRRNNSNYDATTDAGGRFTIQDIDPGDYILFAERSGFSRVQYGERGPNHPGSLLNLQAGARVNDIAFRLIPYSVIAGRVLDEDGEPLESAVMGVAHFAFQGGKRRLISGGGAATDDLGEYRIFDLEPGKYYLSTTYRQQPATVTNERAEQESSEEGYAPTYFPGTSDPAGAVAIEIAAGQVLTGVDITLRKTRTVRIRGRVTSSVADGLPRNLTLALVPRNTGLADYSSPMTSRPARNRAGTFEFRGVPPGAYVLMAQWAGEGKAHQARQSIDVGNDGVDGVVLLLTPGMEVRGQIRIDGPAPEGSGRFHVILEAQGPMAMGGTGAAAKEDGSFVLENVSADNYNVNVLGLGENFYIKSIRMGDVDALATGLDLTSGAAGIVDILISPNGGQAEGAVADSNQQPAAGATVVLAPDARRREQSMLFKTTTADASGHFNIKGIAPGDYKLFAWQDVEAGAYQDPEFLKPYENRGEAISIRDGGHATAQLTAIPAESAPGPKSGGN